MDIELSGNYPIILEGETVGELTVAREGLFWSFDAKCETQKEIIRLSVYGEGREGYLGIMEPVGDMLKLTRKFSRAALTSFPLAITHAGIKGESDELDMNEDLAETNPNDSETDDTGSYSPPEEELTPNIECSSPLENSIPPPEACSRPHYNFSDLEWHPCPVPCSLFSGIEEKKLCRFISGAFSAREDDSLFLAVPNDALELLSESNPFHFFEQLIISGEKYHICKIKHGKSIPEL